MSLLFFAQSSHHLVKTSKCLSDHEIAEMRENQSKQTRRSGQYVNSLKTSLLRYLIRIRRYQILVTGYWKPLDYLSYFIV